MRTLNRVVSLILTCALLFSSFPIETLATSVETEPKPSIEETSTEVEVEPFSGVELTIDTKDNVGQTSYEATTETEPHGETKEAIDSEDSVEQATSEATTETEFPDETEETIDPADMVLQNADSNVMMVASEFEASIGGFVNNEDGLGLADVTVSIFEMTNSGYELYSTAKTDTSGSWKIVDAWIGDTYTIWYYKAGYVFSANNIKVTAESGGVTLETVTASSLKIEGLVCDEADYTYTTDTTAETAAITGYTGNDVAIQLPSELGGYPVVAIKDGVFKNNTTLESVVFSESIASVGANAFDGCTALKNIYLSNILTHIYKYAFNGCNSIESMVLPDSVQHIGREAFSGCSKLSSINIPLSWNSASDSWDRGGIFAGCSSLTSITVPEGVTALPNYAFKDCTYLEEVVLPSSLTEINESAFSGCTSIKSIDLPENLTHIYKYAFYGCNSIESMILPDSVQHIGREAFSGCSKLSSINIPLSWNSASDSWDRGGIFAGCSSLTSITVPEGVTALPSYAFQGANYLRTISLPESLLSVGSYAFDDCEKLRTVVVPRKVSSIGTYAFANCDDLRCVMLSASKSAIGDNLLTNSTKAFLYCPWTSEATIYAIKNNIEFYVLEDEDVDCSNCAVDMEATQYYTTANIAQVERYVPLALNYKFADNDYSDLSNCKIKLTFTSSLSIVANSVFLNGSQVDMGDINYEDNELIVPVTEQSGTLLLSVSPVEAGRMMSTAEITYAKSGTNCSDIVGIIWLDVPLLTINAPSLISGSEFEVSGVTSANETVSLTVNGESVGTAVSKKDGTFSKSITLPMNPAHGTVYTVAAVLESDTSVSTSTTVTYSTEAPILTQFDMYYYGHDLKYLNLLDTQTKANSIWPSKPLKFVVHFDNADSVTEVFVTSTKNGIVSRMQAFPTDNAGEFIAEGFFVENSTSYVPGTINVQYSTKTTVEDYSTDLSKEELPDAWRNSTVDVLSNTGNEYQANIILSNGDEVEFEVQENLSIDEVRNILLAEDASAEPAIAAYSLQTASENDWEIVKGFFKDLYSKYKKNVWSNVEDLADEEDDAVAVIKDDVSQKLIYVFWDSAKGAFETVGIKFIGTNLIYESSIAVPWKDCASAWGFITDGANVIVHAYNNAISLDDAEADIRMSTTLTDEQKAYALEKVEQLRWGYAVTGLLRIAAVAAGYGFTIAGSPMLGTLAKTVLNFAANLADNYLDKALAYYTAGGQGSYLKWILDPSGVVFDATTNERIHGVTVTAYWIEYIEGNSTFWNTPPDSSEYGIIWDATEYSQQNPIQTDSAGSYAWDVPEGWWRVKYEKDGYETVWSDWLTVPPPQTEVNIGMTPIATGAGVTVSGTITSYNDSTGEVTVELVDSTGTVAYSTAITGNSASYELSNVAAGTYTMNVSKANHVTRSYTVVVETADITQDAKICLRGDVTGDGKITATDYSRLLAHVKKTNVITDEYTLLCADVTGEGKITATDYSRLLAHVKKVSLLW